MIPLLHFLFFWSVVYLDKPVFFNSSTINSFYSYFILIVYSWGYCFFKKIHLYCSHIEHLFISDQFAWTLNSNMHHCLHLNEATSQQDFLAQALEAIIEVVMAVWLSWLSIDLCSLTPAGSSSIILTPLFLLCLNRLYKPEDYLGNLHPLLCSITPCCLASSSLLNYQR